LDFHRNQFNFLRKGRKIKKISHKFQRGLTKITWYNKAHTRKFHRPRLRINKLRQIKVRAGKEIPEQTQSTPNWKRERNNYIGKWS